jgi:hypothetical protein
MARRAQAQAGQRRDAQARRDQRLDGHVIVGGERDLRGETGEGALTQQVAAAALAAGDPAPRGVGGEVGRPVVRGLRHQVHRLVEQEPAARALLLGARRFRVGILLVVPEHQRHVDVSGPEHAQRLRRLGLGEHEVHAGALRLQPGRGGRNDRAERGGERGQPYPSLPQPDVRRELVLRRVQPADDLLGPLGQQPARVGEPNAPARPLQQPGSGLGLQAGYVMADRRLRVVQRARRRCHRAVPGHRDEHAEPGHVQHAPSIDRLD